MEIVVFSKEEQKEDGELIPPSLFTLHFFISSFLPSFLFSSIHVFSPFSSLPFPNSNTTLSLTTPPSTGFPLSSHEFRMRVPPDMSLPYRGHFLIFVIPPRCLISSQIPTNRFFCSTGSLEIHKRDSILVHIVYQTYKYTNPSTQLRLLLYICIATCMYRVILFNL